MASQALVDKLVDNLWITSGVWIKLYTSYPQARQLVENLWITWAGEGA